MKRLPLFFAVVCLGIFAAGMARGADGFFEAKQIDGRWWLIAPDGSKFISKGVTTVLFAQDKIGDTNVSPYGENNQAKYGSEEAWRTATAEQLLGWNFNTLGAWSDAKVSSAAKEGKRLAYAPICDIGSAFVAEKQKGAAWLKGIFPDVFDPDFEKFAHAQAAKIAGPLKDDHWLLGWFTDNELRWGPDWRGNEELLTMFLALPPGTPGREAAIALLRQRHGDITKFNDVWHVSFQSWDELEKSGAVKAPFQRKAVYAQNAETERKENEADPKRAAYVGDCEAFLAEMAERYFRITSAALKEADPNHMDFGCRFAYVPPQPVVAAAAKYLNVISFNCYSADPGRVIESYSVFGKPLIIGEFSFRAEDSGLPNSRGAGEKYKTQAERAAAFEKFVTIGLRDPHLVGYHWFEHADEPKEGRFDGENSNYGVVNIHDEPYKELTDAMTRVNRDAEKLHGGQ
ncbi:MAG TPA: hypothetical protein VG733_11200 [Chthoniobacteraceae bacterium]|nr:hypothetical protein [Chthoniobacteraceae bacterium]